MIKLKKISVGALIGVINMILGAGGGIIAVPLYKKLGMNQKSAQINAVATILPITFISTIIYLISNNVNLKDTYVFLIPGVIGGFVGTKLIRKFSNNTLTIIFSLFMLWSGVRMITK